MLYRALKYPFRPQSRTDVLQAIVLAGLAGAGFAQGSPAGPPATMPSLASPTVYPQPGIYGTTESITLLDTDAATDIHYTLDGSDPSDASPTYDPSHLLSVGGVYEGMHGLRTSYTIRAIATSSGRSDSPVATFQFTVDRRDRNSYVSEEIRPGVQMIRDSDNDKMFLIKGTERCLLIDSGQGGGNLRAFLAPYTAGCATDVIFTHWHGDHTGQADQFITDTDEFIGGSDREAVSRMLLVRGVSKADIDRHLKPVSDGQRFELGGHSLVVYAAPGHTPGSLVIFDQKSGDLYCGDSFGSNSPTIPDAVWLQGAPNSLDRYLTMIKRVRASIHGKVTAVMTGHNDAPLRGEAYLDNLETALQTLMDRGDAALTPSLRPAGLQQIQVGDRYTDPNWVSINVNKEHYLPAPVDEITALTQMKLSGAVLDREFSPEIHDYTATAPASSSSVVATVLAASTRVQWIKVNDRRIRSGAPHVQTLAGRSAVLTIVVCAPDGVTTGTYRVAIHRDR